MTYLINKNAALNYLTGDNNFERIDLGMVLSSVEETSRVIETISNLDVDLFHILGMRNLSAFVGEVFARSFAKNSRGRYMSNPHQDGYPDLLLLDSIGESMIKKIILENRMKDKSPFSPFPNGGLEIKATCGSVPTPAVCSAKGFDKPGIGDTRIDYMTGYDWKAHHRETNNLIGLLWDFDQGLPSIGAVFFSSNLDESDWGKIVQPKDGGGRTTSVSIMSRAGVRKMCEGWVLVKDDYRYMRFLEKYNKLRIFNVES